MQITIIRFCFILGRTDKIKNNNVVNTFNFIVDFLYKANIMTAVYKNAYRHQDK